jgi:DNA-directed RNA polymerase specialized sigma24 family protein
LGSVSDHYAYADVIREPLSLDSPVTPGDIDAPTEAAMLADDAFDLQYVLEWAQAEQSIDRWLATLKPRDRDLIERVFWDDQLQADVARDLGVSRAAITKRMNRIARDGRTTLAPLRDCVLLRPTPPMMNPRRDRARRAA